MIFQSMNYGKQKLIRNLNGLNLLLILHNDVTTKDLKQAINEGYDRIEHLKKIYN